MKGTAGDAGPGRVCPVPSCTQTRGLLISPSKQCLLLRARTWCASPSQGVMCQCQQVSQMLCPSPGGCLAPLFAPHRDPSLVVVHWRAVSDQNSPCPCCPRLGVCFLVTHHVSKLTQIPFGEEHPPSDTLQWILSSPRCSFPWGVFSQPQVSPIAVVPPVAVCTAFLGISCIPRQPKELVQPSSFSRAVHSFP